MFPASALHNSTQDAYQTEHLIRGPLPAIAHRKYEKTKMKQEHMHHPSMRIKKNAGRLGDVRVFLIADTLRSHWLPKTKKVMNLRSMTGAQVRLSKFAPHFEHFTMPPSWSCRPSQRPCILHRVRVETCPNLSQRKVHASLPPRSEYLPKEQG